MKAGDAAGYGRDCPRCDTGVLVPHGVGFACDAHCGYAVPGKLASFGDVEGFIPVMAEGERVSFERAKAREDANG